ncbi:NfeD family protein [Sphingorhabdus sp. Alg231-15]|uniref:NfeD family protein n=1 Tax=Sphingorhabdus sp. Alg231-15 TaxID=1922222 RepID=UPI000D56093A
MTDLITTNPAYVWLTLAALLALAEIFVPGVFLIWVAAAAAVTGIASTFIELTLAGQLTLFGLSTIASVLLGRRWYLTNVVKSEDPLLNDRAARMIGTTVTVVKPVNATSGRVKVADGIWSARGPDLKKGETARIVDVADGVLILEEMPEQIT